MANQGLYGNSGWYGYGSRDLYDHQRGQMSQVGGMSHTRTATGLDHHDEMLRRHHQQRRDEIEQKHSKKAVEKQFQTEDEDIYYLLS